MKYVLIFFILLIIELIYFKIADKFNIIDKPNLRSSHSHITLLGGGIIFVISMWLYAVFFNQVNANIYFLLGLTLIATVSFIDDLHSLPKVYRLLFHMLALLLMCCQWGFSLALWWIIIPLLIVAIGLMNIYNFMDGINGITAAYSIAVLIPLMYLNESINYIDKDYFIVIIMAVLIFSFFNFRTNAKCFAGDVGSFSMIFILLFAMGSLMIATQEYWTFIFFAVYGVDGVLTIIHRIYLRENITAAHRKHAYQIMANELKIKHIYVSLIYMLLQLLVSFGAIYFPFNRYIYAIIILLLLSIIYIIFIKKNYYLHKIYLLEKQKDEAVKKTKA